MKKINLFLIVIVICFALVGCKENKEPEEPTNPYDCDINVLFSVYSDHGYANMESGKIKEFTNTDTSGSISNLTSNKKVRVRVIFSVTNKTDEPLHFVPVFKIENAKGYKLTGDDAESNKIVINTENQNTIDEYIEFKGLSKTIEPGLKQDIVYHFIYQCEKEPDSSFLNQPWIFYEGEHANYRKPLKSLTLTLEFPNDTIPITEPNYIFKDNSIIIVPSEKVFCSYINYKLDSTNLIPIKEKDGEFEIEITESNKIGVSLQSAEVLKDDYEKEFNVIVLDFKASTFNDEKIITFDKTENAEYYEIEIYNSENKPVKSDKITNTSYDLKNFVSSIESGTYSIKIYANSDEDLVFKSAAATIYFTVLAAPKLTMESVFYTWQKIDGATAYQVYVNNELFTTTTELQINSNILEYNDEIYVVAISNENNCFNSLPSNKLVNDVA